MASEPAVGVAGNTDQTRRNHYCIKIPPMIDETKEASLDRLAGIIDDLISSIWDQNIRFRVMQKQGIHILRTTITTIDPPI